MSRIYEALKRCGSTLADLTQPGADGSARHGTGQPGNDGLAIARETVRQHGLRDDAALVPVAAAEEARVADELARVRIEEVKVQPSSRIVFQDETDGPGADRFRFLRMRLREYWALGKLRTLLITSPHPGDGKSTTALNLATALAEGGKRTVVLVEGDHYRPALARALGIETGLGLAECLADHLDPLQALLRIEPLRWYLLPAGQSQRNRTELLQSDSLSEVMGTLRRLFDWILIDTPPVIPLADTLLLSRHADASLLVVRADKTPREAVEEALTLLGPKQVLGIVLNGAESVNRLYSQYYGYYKPKMAANDKIGL